MFVSHIDVSLPLSLSLSFWTYPYLRVTIKNIKKDVYFPGNSSEVHSPPGLKSRSAAGAQLVYCSCSMNDGLDYAY